ncbi:hypothetical protein [Absidia glauca]|uniref:Uncharacterized protein n=1 Tax=Absidia glauca TaxID=4829 RepID=A0A168P5P5_ABSGL|nr:hypothetical protein [Absidia glauca]
MHLTNQGSSSSSMIHDRKRKRRGSDGSPLQVRFCTQPSEVIDTYSPVEYDRSGLFPSEPVSLPAKNDNIILTLSFGFVTPLSSCHQPQPQPQLHQPSSPISKNKANKKRPKLSIDTSNIHDGPLYFTNMTTNHQKKEQSHIPEDDHDARVTMENTEMNRRCLVAAV